MPSINVNAGLKSADESRMQDEKLDSKIDYQELESLRTEALKNRLILQLRAREVGKSASLRRVVLRFVADGKYQDANGIIDEYLHLKSNYPKLKKRSALHVAHAKELINAIRAKRNFPNLSQLQLSKQQEILDHAISHFEELKQTLRIIEAMVKDEAINDMRATVWVLRSLVYVVIAIVTTSFFMDFSGSVGRPLWSVFSGFVDSSFKLLVGL